MPYFARSLVIFMDSPNKIPRFGCLDQYIGCFRNIDIILQYKLTNNRLNIKF